MSLKDVMNNEELVQLFNAVLSLKDEQECANFFEDICTLSEIKAMCQRLEVAKRLSAGENYVTIAKETGASSTTVSRVNRCLHYGAGGYAKIFKIRTKGAKKNDKK